MTGAQMDGVDLQSAILTDAILDSASMKDSVLTDAICPHAKFRDANLSGSNLRYAKLQNADFAGADLSSTDLSMADLRCNLNASNLSLIAFSRAHGNIEGQMMVFMSIVIAAVEVAVGLAIIISLVRNRDTVNIEDTSLLKW